MQPSSDTACARRRATPWWPMNVDASLHRALLYIQRFSRQHLRETSSMQPVVTPPHDEIDRRCSKAVITPPASTYIVDQHATLVAKRVCVALGLREGGGMWSAVQGGVGMVPKCDYTVQLSIEKKKERFRKCGGISDSVPGSLRIELLFFFFRAFACSAERGCACYCCFFASRE